MNSTLSKRSALTSVSVPMKYSQENVVIDSMRGIGFGYGFKQGTEPYKIELHSQCSKSIESSVNASPFGDSTQVVVGRAIPSGKTARVEYAINYEVEQTPTVPYGINGIMCVNAIEEQSTLRSILRDFRQKTISFWFDLSVSKKKLSKNPQTVETGEVSFGEPNPTRFKKQPGKGIFLHLEPFNKNPEGWVTRNGVNILIAGITDSARRKVTIDISAPMTLLPQDMFNLLISKSVREPPENVDETDVPTYSQPLLSDYNGQRQQTFPCKNANQIRGFQLNGFFEVPNRALFDQISKEQCVLRVAPHESAEEKNLVFGLPLLKQFHTTRDFGNIPSVTLLQRAGPSS